MSTITTTRESKASVPASAPAVATGIAREMGDTGPALYAHAVARGEGPGARFTVRFGMDGDARRLAIRIETDEGAFNLESAQGESAAPLEPADLRALSNTLALLAEAVERELPAREAEAAEFLARYREFPEQDVDTEP